MNLFSKVGKERVLVLGDQYMITNAMGEIRESGALLLKVIIRGSNFDINASTRQILNMDVITYTYHYPSHEWRFDALGVNMLDWNSQVIWYNNHFVPGHRPTTLDVSWDWFVRQFLEHWELLEEY